MQHDVAYAVLPGAAPLGMPCPDCKRILPPQAGGFKSGVPIFGKPTVEELYEKARAGKVAPLHRYMDPNRYPHLDHGAVIDPGREQERPCQVGHLSAWLLAHCRTVEEVHQWLLKLKPYWPQPPADS